MISMLIAHDDARNESLATLDRMTDIEFNRVCDFAARAYGLDMKSKRVLLDCRLAQEQKLAKANSFSSYLNLVESGTDQTAQHRFVDRITTHYTYFMRESSQFDFLVHTAFPHLEKTRPNRPWRILCAGCSTGEECYTLAMMVEDYAHLHRIPEVRITGLDVSALALKSAREGVYSPSHLSKIPPHWRMTYFTAQGDNLRVNNDVRRRVRFGCANLAQNDPLTGMYDIVFCRNVIIYFNDETRRHAQAVLAKHLEPGGYLALGHAEIMHDREQFEYCGNSLYQKRKEAMPC